MRGWYAWLSERDGYIISFVTTVLGLLSAFGTTLSTAQTIAVTATVSAALALVLGRTVTRTP